MPIIGGAAPIPRAFMPVTSPPVSGAIYTNSTGTNLGCSLTVSLNPTTGKESSVVVELSTNGITWTTYATAAIPKGISLSGAVQQIFMTIPNGWYYRATSQNAVIGQLVAIG